MIYRDSLPACPRCHVDLEDAGAARGCPQCSGIWIGLPDVQEMAAKMQYPPIPVPLMATEVKRAPLACPECETAMQPLVLFGVEIDACFKRHGVWFDALELGQVLLKSATAAAPR